MMEWPYAFPAVFAKFPAGLPNIYTIEAIPSYEATPSPQEKASKFHLAQSDLLQCCPRRGCPKVTSEDPATFKDPFPSRKYKLRKWPDRFGSS